MTTLYREIDALGGAVEDAWGEGYSQALTDVLAILTKHGHSEQSHGDAHEVLTGLCEAIDDLIGSSEGVAGLHLNGDLAPWDDLQVGGHFEAWLLPLDTAHNFIAKSRGVA